MAKVEQIQDDEIRALVDQARIDYRSGNSTESVHNSVEALLLLMQKKPDFIQMERIPNTPIRMGRVWPPFGVKVETGENQSLRAVYDRDQFSKAEAITFYEFALDSVVAAEL